VGGALLLASCAASSDPDAPRLADVVSVEVRGEAGAFELAVGIRSADTGCEQYADWWEVVDAEGRLLYRRILRHSHVDEQPFVRSGGPIALDRERIVWVRAHLHPSGYGGRAMTGSVDTGFAPAKPEPGFAAALEDEPPLPEGCAF